MRKNETGNIVRQEVQSDRQRLTDKVRCKQRNRRTDKRQIFTVKTKQTSIETQRDK